MSGQGRYVWLDALRFTAGVSMVGLHASADPTGQPWVKFDEVDRIAPMLFRAVIYTARTELFLIISVFLLLFALDRRPRTYAVTIREQARRLLIPFLFWTVFYALYNLIKADAFGYSGALIDKMADPTTWPRYLLLGEVKYHMHFIPTLFGLVLLFPLFRLAVAYPALGLLILACLMVKRELDMAVWSSLWGTEALPYVVRVVKILTYVGYGMVAGAALGLWRRMAGDQLQRWFPIVCYIGGLLFMIKLVAAWKTVEGGAWPHDYTPGYWADFLMPVLLFLGCMMLGHKKWPDRISRIAPYSFGIYLCHPIFLDAFEIMLRGQGMGPSAQIAIKVAGGIALTSALVVIIGRIPALAWTIGLGPTPFIGRGARAAA